MEQLNSKALYSKQLGADFHLIIQKLRNILVTTTVK